MNKTFLLCRKQMVQLFEDSKNILRTLVSFVEHRVAFAEMQHIYFSDNLLCSVTGNVW